jgi:hypothetical protein
MDVRGLVCATPILPSASPNLRLGDGREQNRVGMWPQPRQQVNTWRQAASLYYAHGFAGVVCKLVCFADGRHLASILRGLLHHHQSIQSLPKAWMCIT